MKSIKFDSEEISTVTENRTQYTELATEELEKENIYLPFSWSTPKKRLTSGLRGKSISYKSRMNECLVEMQRTDV